MINKVLKDTYLKIHISKYFSCLQSLDERYAEGQKTAQNIQSNIKLARSFSMMPPNLSNRIYSLRKELLFKIVKLTRNKNADELNDLLEDNKLLSFDKYALYRCLLHNHLHIRQGVSGGLSKGFFQLNN